MQNKIYIDLPTVIEKQYDNRSEQCKKCYNRADELGVAVEDVCDEDCSDEGVTSELYETTLTYDLSNIVSFNKSKSNPDEYADILTYTGEYFEAKISKEALSQKLRDNGITVID